MQVTVKMSTVHPKDPEASPCGVDDMTKLAYLHEPGVLQNLKSRFDMNEIYVSHIILTSNLIVIMFLHEKSPSYVHNIYPSPFNQNIP